MDKIQANTSRANVSVCAGAAVGAAGGAFYIKVAFGLASAVSMVAFAVLATLAVMLVVYALCSVFIKNDVRVNSNSRKENYQSEISKEEKAAKIIQRAVRRHLFLKKDKEIAKDERNELVEKMLDYDYQTKIERYPAMPFDDLCLSADKIDAFLSGIPKKKRHLAEKFIKSIKRVGFAKFKNKLRKTLLDTLSAIKSYPPDRQKYVIVNDAPDKSTAWVIAQAKEVLALHPPEAIVHRSKLKEYLAGHPEVFHVVFADDAVYSGSQMALYLESVKESLKDRLVHLAVVYATSRINRLVNARDFDDIRFRVASHEFIPQVYQLDLYDKQFTLKELLSNRRFFESKAVHGNYAGKYGMDRAIIFFDHKLPDSVSNYDRFIEALLKQPMNSTSSLYNYRNIGMLLKGMSKEDKIESVAEIGKDLAAILTFVKAPKGDFLALRQDKWKHSIKVNGQERVLSPQSRYYLTKGDVITCNNFRPFQYDGKRLVLH